MGKSNPDPPRNSLHDPFNKMIRSIQAKAAKDTFEKPEI